MRLQTILTLYSCFLLVFGLLIAAWPVTTTLNLSPLPTPTLQLTPPHRPTPTGWFVTPDPRQPLHVAVYLPVISK